MFIPSVFLVLALTGCSQSGSMESAPNLDADQPSAFPKPAIADNRIPKSCDLPEIEDLLSGITGGDISITENPVNEENSTEEAIQSYLEGRYLVCIYTGPDSSESSYVIWDEGVAEEWLSAMADANEDLQPGEALFEPVSLGLGEAGAFVMIEGDEQNKAFTGHTFISDVSVFVYSAALDDVAQGQDFLNAAIRSIP
jgi:hypothetical protein